MRRRPASDEERVAFRRAMDRRRFARAVACFSHAVDPGGVFEAEAGQQFVVVSGEVREMVGRWPEVVE